MEYEMRKSCAYNDFLKRMEKHSVLKHPVLKKLPKEEKPGRNTKAGRRALKIKIQANMQMMSGVTSFLGGMIAPTLTGLYTAKKINEYGAQIMTTNSQAQGLIQNTDRCIGTFESLALSLKSIVDSIAVSATQTKEVVSDTMSIIIELVMSLTRIVFAKDGSKLTMLMFEFAAIFVKYGLKHVWELLLLFINKKTKCDAIMKNIPDLDPEIQAEIVSMQNSDEVRGTLSKVIEYFGFAIVGILSTVLLKDGITGKSTFSLLKQITSIAMLVKTVKDLDNAFPQILSSISTFIYGKFGFVVPDTLSSIINDYDHWRKRVMEIMIRDPVNDDSASDKVSYDRYFVNEVEQIYKQSIELMKAMNEKRVPVKEQKQFLYLCKYVENLYKKTDLSGAFGGKPRTEPVVLWFVGESGQGKSFMTFPLAMSLVQAINKDVDADHIAEEVYYRNVEQEYWDGYRGQTVVVYDDFGQLIDSAAKPNPEFLEIIKTVNIAAYPLHMASIEEKRRARFTSKGILLSSNIENFNINSITKPEAFYRRVDIGVRVSVKKEYAYEAKPGVFRLDPTKIPEQDEIFTDCYNFERFNPETREVLDRDMSYEELNEMLIKIARSKYTRSRDYIQKCMNKIAANIQITHIYEPETAIDGKDPMIGVEVPKEEKFEESVEDIIYEFHSGMMYKNLETGDLLSGREIDALLTEDPTLYEKFTRLFVECKKKTLESFKELSEKVANGLRSFYEKCKKFASENIGLVTVGLLGTVISAIGAYQLWKWFIPAAERITVVSDGLGFTNSNRLSSVVSKIVTGKDDKFLVNEKMFKQGKDKIAAACEMADKHVKICIVPEATASGDSVTRNMPKVRVEAVASGDMKTNSIPKIKVEAISSGDALTRSVAKAKVEGIETIPANMQMWKDEQAQTLITNRIWSNLYRLSGVKKDNTIVPLLNGLFVRSRCMLVPGHLLDFIAGYNKLYLQNITGESYEIPWEKITKIPILDRIGNGKEAAMLVFPRSVKCHVDITKHFQDGESLSLYRRADVCLPLVRYGKSIDKMFCVVLGNTECVAYDKPIILEDDEKGDYMLRAGLRYKLNTIAGDCGAPLIVNETSVLRKIAGIHVAGAKDGSAFAESITQADLDRALKHVGKNDQVIFDPDVTPNFEFLRAQMQIGNEYYLEDMLSLLKVPHPNFSLIGQVSKTVFSPGKTTLRPSLIYGDVTEPTTKPCYLHHKDVDMYYKNLEKFANQTPFIEDDNLEAAVNDVRRVLLNNRDPKLARVLTMEEAVRGSEDSEYMGPICRSTSAGYPWVLERPSGAKGKQYWLGDDEYKITEDVVAAVEKRIEAAAKGIRIPVIWSDTLKDERRPIEKVEKLKTRVFAHGPMDFTIAFRRYFLGFMAQIMENRITNEQSVGTNVYSRDWAMTAKKLQEKGKKVIAGDFSCFDGTLNTAIMARFADVVSDWYDDGEENRLIRNVLMMEVYNSMHLVHNILYMMNHSQPSGNPSTTILNSFYNSVSMRIVFQLCAKKANVFGSMKTFNENVSMVSYGDDNVINISDKIIGWFNQNTITDGYAQIGMTYTDEAKTGEVMADYRSIGEVAYLKRNFDQRGRRWFAPLALDTVLEMCNWRRGDIDPISATQVNCEMAIMELSLHTKDVWNQWKPKIEKSFFDKTGTMLETLTYEEFESKRLFDYFL